MDTIADEQLLQKYTESGELRYFDALVRRHVGKGRAAFSTFVLDEDRHWNAFGRDVVGYLAMVPKAGDPTISIGITGEPARGCVWDIPIKYLRSEDLEYLKSCGWRPGTE